MDGKRLRDTLGERHDGGNNDSPALPWTTSRRDFLAGSLTFSTALATGSVSAPAGAPKPPGRIDVHHHFIPDFQLKAVAPQRDGTPPQPWTLEKSLADMEAAGVQTAILSIIQPGVWLGDIELARRLARACNDFGAKLVKNYPGRFGLWAALPLPDVDGSLREVEYAFDTLKADGVELMTSIGNKYVGDPAFAPVFDELNRRKAIAFVHPVAPACCHGLVPGIPPSMIEYATDTARAIASLLFGGMTARAPDLRFIFANSGGTLPMLAGHFVRQASLQRLPFLPKGPVPELQKFFYEVSQGASQAELAALTQLVPMSQLLYGSDFPFHPGTETVQALNNDGLSEDDRRAIDRDNAVRLVERLKT